jgi:hypothetical protein
MSRAFVRMSAFDPSAAAGQQAEGSLLARLPPIVPRDRTAGSPIWPASAASAG